MFGVKLIVSLGTINARHSLTAGFQHSPFAACVTVLIFRIIVGSPKYRVRAACRQDIS